MLGKETEVDDAMEGILTQITIGNGSKWHDVYLDVPKDKKQFPEFVTLKEGRRIEDILWMKKKLF